LSREPSYISRDFDLDEKVDVDPADDVLDIGKPTPAHIKKKASHSAV
jgi:hypothetical protein